jgi:hypothetical protein
MEGCSDGVYGFAATLLVLSATPLQQVPRAWPGYLACIVSFLTFGGWWLLHTALTDQLARADQLFPQLNCSFLFIRPVWRRGSVSICGRCRRGTGRCGRAARPAGHSCP